MKLPSLSTKKRHHRILMMVETDWEYGRELVLGARHYAFTTGRFQIGPGTHNKGTALAKLVRQQSIDGIIARVTTPKMESEMLRLPVPVVNVSNILNTVRLPLVTQDDMAVGRLAAEHLLACGCTTFAYWEDLGERFSLQRIRGFRLELERCMPQATCIAGGSGPKEESARLLVKMQKWLKKLPPQTGVFAVFDPFALHLMQAARELGRDVPEDLAVLGAGDDQFWTDFESIPLSSVKLPAWQIGVEAVTLLEELMQSKKPYGSTPPQRYLPVTEVAKRQSTDILYTKDEAVAKAVAFIRTHAGENIYVADVARAAGVSRSGLQRRFAVILGRSILAEIQRGRIERVKTLLRTTDMKMTDISAACNFPSTPCLHILFRRYTGQTPGEYRAVFHRR
ncbi:MAG: hypothetical protein B9S32_08995 [Verrucomicrobia bacterium Tous-C9LFEB]|nr:MAG: hypothetical protein B9S32_08995 [Verrucomicrobia bacterium Tous-C9LFEB]